MVEYQVLCRKTEFTRLIAILGEEGPENLGEMGNNRDIYSYSNREVVSFERGY